MKSFNEVCELVRNTFYKDWENRENSRAILEVQKRAMMFYQKEKDFMLNRISEIIDQAGPIDTSTIPSWYFRMNGQTAIYNEIWGWGPAAEWFIDDYKDSPRFIISGENCFVERNGHQKLMKQRVDKKTVDRIIKTLECNNDASLECAGTFSLQNGVTVSINQSKDIILTRPTPSLITKQDITLELWSKFMDKYPLAPIDLDCIKSCTMRKTNSFGITLKDGRQFKVIVKDLFEGDEQDD